MNAQEPIRIGSIMTVKAITPPLDWNGTPEDAIKRGTVDAQSSGHNLVVNTGLQLFAQTIYLDSYAYNDETVTSNLYPMYGALGTSSTPAAAGQTTLGTEIGRTDLYTPGSFVNMAVVTLSFFYGFTEVVGTLTECGLFGATTNTIDAPTMINRVVFSPAVTKTSSQTATLEVELTILPG